MTETEILLQNALQTLSSEQNKQHEILLKKLQDLQRENEEIRVENRTIVRHYEKLAKQLTELDQALQTKLRRY